MTLKKITLIKIIPVLIFFLLIIVAFGALKKNDTKNIPSVLIGKNPPPLSLKKLGNFPNITNKDLEAKYEKKIRLINFWASWCPPCRVEHPQLEKLSKIESLEIFGVNYKDNQKSALNFINQFGNPYSKIGSDTAGRNAIEWGVYGVPETFVLDQNGYILYRHAGPITKEIFESKFIYLFKK